MCSALKILWIKAGPLYPLDTGGKKRTHSMLVEMSRRHEVTYLALKNEASELDAREPGGSYAARKIWVPWRESPARTPRFFLELLRNLATSSLPYALQKYRSSRMEKEVVRLCTEEDFDLVVCDFLTPAVNLMRVCKRLKPSKVLFQHNVEAQIWKRLAAGKENPVARWYFRSQFRRMEDWERRLSEMFDGVIMVSPEDVDLARREYGLQNVLGDVPAGVDADYFQPDPGAKEERAPTVGFLGSMDWMPNVEAVTWFADEIFPEVKNAIEGVNLLVIGRRPPPSIAALASKDRQIEVTGTVDDVRPYLKRCDLLVVPLLSGGGTRIKIMESLAAGLPVVSTSVGAEGLGLVDGEHLLIADTVPEFVDAVGRLISDTELRHRLSANGRVLVQSDYSWARATEVFMDHAMRVSGRLVTGPEVD